MKNHRIIGVMARLDLHFKVVIDLDDAEDPEKLATEICRQISRIYGVRSAELSNYVAHTED